MEAGRFGPRGGIIWVLLAVVVIPLLLGYALLRAVDVGARAQVVPQSPVENAAASIRVEGPRQAEAAVLAFTPSGAQENIQQAILNATGHPGRLGRGGLPGTASARPSGHGRWQVVFRVPVDLSVLEAEGAIGFGSLPGASNPARGRLTVNAPDGNVYGLKTQPPSQIAVFRFAVSGTGTLLWPGNMNAVAVVNQAQAMN